MAKLFWTIAFMTGISFSASISASSVIEKVAGVVRAGATPSSLLQVKSGQRIATGSTYLTGSSSHAVLRFEDGHRILLGENTEFAVSEHSFSTNGPKGERFVFDLRKGALRSISSDTKSGNRAAYTLRSPHTTLGILGTDVMIALSGATFVSISKGTLSAANSAGAAAFGQGMAAIAVSATTPPSSISSAMLPPSVTSAFQRLSSISLLSPERAYLELR